jgi:hypothetical protein
MYLCGKATLVFEMLPPDREDGAGKGHVNLGMGSTILDTNN